MKSTAADPCVFIRVSRIENSIIVIFEDDQDMHTLADSNYRLTKLMEEEAFVPKFLYHEYVGGSM